MIFRHHRPGIWVALIAAILTLAYGAMKWIGVVG